MYKKIVVLASVFLLYAVYSVLFTAHVNAATYTITPSESIATAINLLKAGDTLFLRGGVYNDTIQIGNNSNPSGSSWNNPTTITSYQGERAILRPSGPQSVLNIAATTVQPVIEYIIIDGLTLDGSNLGNGNDHKIAGIAGEGGTPYRANHIRITNSELVNAPDGYFVFVSANDVQFINNKLHDSYAFNTSYLGGGTGCNQSICWGYPFYWAASGGLIEGNEIYNFPSFGIHMYCGSCSPSNNIIRNNIIHNFSTTYWPTPPPGAIGSGDPRGAGIIVYGSNNSVYNNTVYNGSYGITVSQSATNAQVYNNNVYNITNPGPYDVGGSGAPTPTPSTSCPNLWNSTLAVPANFGASFNWFSNAKELLMNVYCSGSTATANVGNGSSVQYIYKTGYTWSNNQWTSFNYSGQNMDAGGNWFIGSANKSLGTLDLTQKQSVLAYICEWNGTSWKCGCNTSACTTNHWNLQQFKQ